MNNYNNKLLNSYQGFQQNNVPFNNNPLLYNNPMFRNNMNTTNSAQINQMQQMQTTKGRKDTSQRTEYHPRILSTTACVSSGN